MRIPALIGCSLYGLTAVASASTTAHVLSGGSFSQNWTNIDLITTNDDWSGIPSIMGYRGDDATALTGVDPSTLVANYSAVTDVNANQTAPNTFNTGGVTEFQLTDPVVALTGSGTADAPHLVLYLDATGMQAITINYDLVDIDGSTDNSVQPVALQYRLGGTGNYTNLSMVADASSGPSLTGAAIPVSAILPAGADNQSLVEIRILTTNAAGNDEWIGVDNIRVSATPVIPEPASAGLLALAGMAMLRRRR